MDAPALRPFTEQDKFLRRVMKKDHVKRGLIRWRAFKDRDPRMSLTFRDASLQLDADVDAYHAYFSKRAGVNLHAILWFSFLGLTERIEPPLEPRHNPDPDDPTYGHLHCDTEAPRDKPHMELLAKLVNDGDHAGIERVYE